MNHYKQIPPVSLATYEIYETLNEVFSLASVLGAISAPGLILSALALRINWQNGQ